MLRRALIAVAVSLPLLLPVRDVSAQARTPTAGEVLADSVARLSEPALRTLYRAAPPQSAPPADHLFHGLVARRLYDLEPADAVRKAAERSFDRAKDLDPQQAWAHYGYGWALAESGEVRLPVPGLRRLVTLASLTELVGLDHVSRAQRALRRALELDPGLTPAAVDLARLALVTRSAEDGRVAADALTAALARTPGDATAHIVLAELQLARGETAAAADIARTALSLSDNPSVRRVLALTLLSSLAERETGAGLYFEAFTLAAADSVMVSAYEADLLPIVAPGELEAWRSLAPGERAGWLRRFWERRANTALLSLGERLAEHFERMRVADQLYRRKADYQTPSTQAFLFRGSDDLPYDDRGLVYLRYGKPDTTVASPPSFNEMPPPNESWVYYRPGERPLAFHFFKLEGSPDWVIADGPRCYPFHFARGNPNEDAMEPIILRVKRQSVEGYARYYEDRAFIDTRNAQLANNCRQLVTNIEQADRAQGSNTHEELVQRSMDNIRRATEIAADQRRQVQRALRTEDAMPSYTRPLPVLTTIYAFRGEQGSDVTAAVLIPSEQFSASEAGDGAVYPLRLSLVLHDSASGSMRSTHELQRFGSPETLPAGRYFRVMMHTSAEPFERGEYRLRVENEGQPSEGQVQVGTNAVPDFSGGSLQLSDLVVAEAEGGRWHRGAVAVSPIPTHQIETGRSFRLFYEVYNIAAEAQYRTTLQIRPAEAQGLFDRIRGIFGRGRTIELTFDDVARPSDGKFGVQEVRTIGAELSPGRYVMNVIVTDLVSGARAERSAPLNIIPVQGAR